MRDIHHALVLNMHQPPGNLETLLETQEWEAKEILFAYDRMPRVLWDYQDIARVHLSLSGTLSDSFTREFFPNKAFVSCHGVSAEHGFTDGNLHEVAFRREIISIAEKVYFLVDHSKFGKLGPIKLGGLEICDVFITDRKPPAELEQQLKQSNPDVEIIVCGD